MTPKKLKALLAERAPLGKGHIADTEAELSRPRQGRPRRGDIAAALDISRQAA